MSSRPSSRRPRIHMIDSEADSLTTLALNKEEQFPEVCEMLLEEIGRASIHSAAKFPSDAISMGSIVTYHDDGSNTDRTVSIVYPADANIDQGRISILTPIGAGLIGLREGQVIDWPDREGHKRSLTITSVEQPVRAD